MGSEDEFFDELYQLWSNTTGAGDRFWMPEEFDDGSHRFKLYAVAEDGQPRKLIATGLNERDAEFVAGLHGAVPDLIRALSDAIAEAERADYERDSGECRIAELELELVEMKQIISNFSKTRLGNRVADLRTRIAAALRKVLLDTEWSRGVESASGEQWVQIDGVVDPTELGDAVIRALGLERQAHYDPHCAYHRYVTDWRADDE